MVSSISKEETVKTFTPVNPIDQDYFTVYRYLLCKAKENGINVCESYPFPAGGNLPSVVVLLNGMSDMVIGLSQSSTTIQERVKSLACCFVFRRLPGGWKKTFRVSQSTYCWLESINGQRDPEIDHLTGRYVSFLLHKIKN